MSRVGSFLCAFYAATSVASVIWAYSGNDPKGRFVLLQLPIALQLALADALGFGPLLTQLNWFEAYGLFGTATLALLYCLGLFVERLWRLANLHSSRTAP